MKIERKPVTPQSTYDLAGGIVELATATLGADRTREELQAALDEHCSTGDPATLGMLRIAIKAKS